MAHAGRFDLTEEQMKRLEEMARSRTPAARRALRAKGESLRSIGQAHESKSAQVAIACIVLWLRL